MKRLADSSEKEFLAKMYRTRLLPWRKIDLLFFCFSELRSSERNRPLQLSLYTAAILSCSAAILITSTTTTLLV